MQKQKREKKREEDDIQRFIPWPRDQDGEWPSILEDICAQRLLSLWLAVSMTSGDKVLLSVVYHQGDGG